MPAERKARWRKEMEWFLSVTDHIVEFVPSQQISQDGSNMEVRNLSFFFYFSVYLSIFMFFFYMGM